MARKAREQGEDAFGRELVGVAGGGTPSFSNVVYSTNATPATYTGLGTTSIT